LLALLIPGVGMGGGTAAVGGTNPPMLPIMGVGS
jgi:hypothetical protein